LAPKKLVALIEIFVQMVPDMNLVREIGPLAKCPSLASVLWMALVLANA
jgi:hypothetical protein